MPRKHPSGHEKRKKKQRIEALINSQKGAMNKYISRSPVAVNPESKENKRDEPNVEIDNSGVNRNEIVECDSKGEELGSGEKKESNVESKNGNLIRATQNEGLDDPSNWGHIDNKLRDLLVERGPLRKVNVNFRKDKNGRHFSSVHYTRVLPNGEKFDRKWLVYYETAHRIFCFSCKLFKQESNIIQLANEGYHDWRNIGERLKSHEKSCEHLACSIKWTELKKRLQKKETIETSIQSTRCKTIVNGA